MSAAGMFTPVSTRNGAVLPRPRAHHDLRAETLLENAGQDGRRLDVARLRQVPLDHVDRTHRAAKDGQRHVLAFGRAAGVFSLAIEAQVDTLPHLRPLPSRSRIQVKTQKQVRLAVVGDGGALVEA